MELGVSTQCTSLGKCNTPVRWSDELRDFIDVVSK